MNPIKVQYRSVAARDNYNLPGKYSGKGWARAPLGMSIVDTAVELAMSIDDDIPLPDYDLIELIADFEKALAGVDLRMITLSGDRSDIPAADLTEEQTEFMDSTICVWVALSWDMSEVRVSVTFKISCLTKGMNPKAIQSIIERHAATLQDSLEDIELPLVKVVMETELLPD